MTLGQDIAASRHQAHKTLRQVAADIGVSPALLSLIERGKQKPSAQTVVKLAATLGGDADLWCAKLGKLTPEAEGQLADIAKDDPGFFRTMLKRLGR